MTRSQGLEWIELAYKKGYRDGYDDRQAANKKELARSIIGPVYGNDDAVLLRDVYKFGRSAGWEQLKADLAEEEAA